MVLRGLLAQVLLNSSLVNQLGDEKALERDVYEITEIASSALPIVGRRPPDHAQRRQGVLATKHIRRLYAVWRRERECIQAALRRDQQTYERVSAEFLFDILHSRFEL